MTGAGRVGALRSLWSDSLWPEAELFNRGLCGDQKCRACPHEAETIGHAFVERPALTQRLLDDEGICDLDPKLAASRDAVLDQGPIGEGRQEIDSIAIAIGIPRWPNVKVPRPPSDLPCFVLGDCGSPAADCSDCVFADGSGCRSDVPELRRCGWAAAMIDANGVPVRAAHGGLAGGQQTAGRAERVAGLKAPQHMRTTRLIVSDLLEFVNEGRQWKAGEGG